MAFQNVKRGTAMPVSLGQASCDLFLRIALDLEDRARDNRKASDFEAADSLEGAANTLRAAIKIAKPFVDKGFR